MPMPQLPSSINVAKWKSAAKEADKANVSAAIDKVAKAHLAIDPKPLAAAKPKALDEANKLRDQLDAQAKSVEAVRDAVKSLGKAGDTVLGQLKAEKDKAKAKANGELSKMLTAIVDDADSYLKDLEKAFAEAGTAIAAALKDLASKEEAEGEGEGDDANLDKLLGRVQGVLLRDLPKYEPKKGQPSAFRFFMAWIKGDALLLAGKTKFGPPHAEMIKESWGKSFVPANVTNGDLSFDAATMTWIFSCRGKLPPKNSLVLALKKDKTGGGVGKAIRFKLQKLVKGKNGEEQFEDATDQDDAAAETDVQQPAQQPQSPAAAQAEQIAKALMARLETMKSKFDQRVAAGGAEAQVLKELDKKVREDASRNPGAAKTALDELVKRLGGAPGAPATAGAPTAATADAAVPLPAFGSALKTWLDTRKRYASEVKALAGSLESIYREELATKDPKVVKAIGEAKVKLTKTADLIGPECEQALGRVMQAGQRKAQQQAAVKAKAELEALAKKLMADPVFQSLDGKNNELKPDMKVVSEIRQALVSVQTAMADALKA